MRKGRRLCLHAVGVGGDDGFDMLFGAFEQAFAQVDQRFDGLQQTIPQVHPRDGGGEILPAAAGVQARGFLTGDFDQPRFVIEIVGGSARREAFFAGFFIVDDRCDAFCDALRDILRHDAGFGEHDDRRLVDVVEEFDRAAAAAEGGVDIEGGVGQGVLLL